jgi:hypothetical protein
MFFGVGEKGGLDGRGGCGFAVGGTLGSAEAVFSIAIESEVTSTAETMRSTVPRLEVVIARTIRMIGE